MSLFQNPLPAMRPDPVASIAGNADHACKARVLSWWEHYLAGSSSGQFGGNVKPHVKLAAISTYSQGEGAGRRKKLIEIVHEATVTEAFLNCNDVMHGGCTAFLIDICTTTVLFPFSEEKMNVSLNLDVSYHAPAPLGARLRIVSTSVALNKRVVTLRCEVWDAARGTLIATGKHMKMYAQLKEAKL